MIGTDMAWIESRIQRLEEIRLSLENRIQRMREIKMTHENRIQRLEETLYTLLNYLRDQEQSSAGANWRRVQAMIDHLHRHAQAEQKDDRVWPKSDRL
jgi:hypothetical protein